MTTECMVNSPNKRLQVTFEIRDVNQAQRVAKSCALYRIDLDGKPLILDSCLQLVFEMAAPIAENLTIQKYRISSNEGTWKPVYGERSQIPDNYNEMEIELQEKYGKRRKLKLTFRAYDEGIAFQYAIPKQVEIDSFTLLREYTQFHFPKGCYCYEEHGTEGEYFRVPIQQLKNNCERPLTIEYPNGKCISLTEAALDNYSRMLLSLQKGKQHILFSDLSGPVQGKTPFSTPWRVFIVGDSPGQLLEHNYLLLNLNAPCQIDDTSWIKPGKAMREVTLSTSGGFDCVDFASAQGIDYISFDAGWYGREDDPDSDATTVSIDPERLAQFPDHDGELDLQEVIRYADSKGIGVILYVNHRALEKQLDQLLPLYSSWGVKGIKFGFVEVGPQKWTTWLHDAVRKCAEHRLLVDIHDGYRPTGFSRTYPNLLTQEGIRGNEHMPTSSHNATLPFTRMIAGAADYTICFYDSRIKNSRSHQMAMSIIIYSPLQFLFWYDRPSDYQGEPEVELFRQLPVVWDETKVIEGEIGKFAIIARRSGDQWFIGAITDQERREKTIPLQFLETGRIYEAFICSDHISMTDDPAHVSIKTIELTKEDTLQLMLGSHGGSAIWIRPK